jgi:hypothetical protein
MTKKVKINAQCYSFLILAAFQFFKQVFGRYCQCNYIPLSNCQNPQMGFVTNLIPGSQGIS